jgi:hypothetical protein
MPGFKGKRKGGLTLTLYKKKHFDIQCLYIACITAKETSKNLFGVEDPVKMSLSFFGPDINRIVQWFDKDESRQMRYSPSTLQFFWLGRKLFGGCFIRFMSGPKNESEFYKLFSAKLIN